MHDCISLFYMKFMLETHVYEHGSWFVTDSGLSISTNQLYQVSPKL